MNRRSYIHAVGLALFSLRYSSTCESSMFSLGAAWGRVSGFIDAGLSSQIITFGEAAVLRDLAQNAYTNRASAHPER